MKIGILDYGCGNIYSLFYALKKINDEVFIVNKPDSLKNFDILFLPGVGAFKSAMDKIKINNFDNELIVFSKSGKKIIGICLGMQLLCTNSEEFGFHKGLNLIPGNVKKFNQGSYILPHIGWNLVKFDKNLYKDNFFYFLHSFKVVSQQNYTFGTTSYYDQNFSSVIKKDNVIGCQFHPEKSGIAGIDFLKKLIDLKD